MAEETVVEETAQKEEVPGPREFPTLDPPKLDERLKFSGGVLETTPEFGAPVSPESERSASEKDDKNGHKREFPKLDPPKLNFLEEELQRAEVFKAEFTKVEPARQDSGEPDSGPADSHVGDDVIELPAPGAKNEPVSSAGDAPKSEGQADKTDETKSGEKSELPALEAPKPNLLEERLRRAEAFKADLLRAGAEISSDGGSNLALWAKSIEAEVSPKTDGAEESGPEKPATSSSEEADFPLWELEPPGPRLKYLIKALHLNFDDLAFIFQVSSSRLNQWFEEPSLEGEQEMELQYCLEVAKLIEKIDMPRFDLVVRCPLSDGEFFVEKIKGRKITDENLRTLRKIAGLSEEQRRKRKGADKEFHAMQDVISLYATPLRYEVQ